MNPPFQEMLGRYADVAVRVGANLQPGQPLAVLGNLESAPLIREVVRSAYQLGAPLVHVFYNDEQVTLARFKYAPRDSFTEFPEWIMRVNADLIDAGVARLNIISDDPDLLRDQDPDLIATSQRTLALHAAPIRERITRGAINWAIVAAPSASWAAKVFPDTPEDQRETKLWETIFATCRIDQSDPVAAWRAHIADLHTRSAYLNQKRYSALRYRGPGTDMTLGLADNHIWMSGSMRSENGVEFVANLPTEEVFTMPHRASVNGTVRATKPLDLGGSLIEDFSLTFHEGRVIDVKAGKGEALLRNLIQTDEGAARLGEVALVPESSPIARSGRIFYNTLFDENAASHVALGMAYRFTMQDGVAKDAAAFEAAGGNSSNIHVDFMIGSFEIDVDGVKADGSSEPVMRRGEWAF